MLLKLKDDDLFNDVLNLDRIHNSILPVWTLYASERKAMTVLIEVEGAKFNPEDGSSAFEYPKNGNLARKIYEVEQLAEQLVGRAKADAKESAGIIARLAEHINQRLKLGIGVAAV